MKHLTRLAIIVLLSVCLYISMRHPARAAVESDRSFNQPPSKSATLTEALGGKSVEVDSQPNGNWQVLLNETFEEAWPSSGWSVTDLSNDGYDRKWGSDDYRPHTPSLKAAWPARSGRNGRDPTSKNNDYFNTMDTRMIYGPFDLSDASTLEISFWMWWQTEANRDYLILETSGDNLTFTELGRWQGTSSGWQLIDISTDDYALDGSVWVAWRFTSNASTVFDGPWVDDISLRKYLGNFVDVQGTLSYYDRHNDPIGAAYVTVELYDYDIGGDGDDLIITGYTELDGSFYFSHIYNIDEDEYPYQGLDLYVVWKTKYDDSDTSHHQVENLDGQIYKWESEVKYNVSDPIVEFNKVIPSVDPELGAIWLFKDLDRAWNYFYYKTSPSYDPGSVTIKWELNENCYTILGIPICNSFFYAYPGDSFIFIRSDYRISSDMVIHEIGHAYMYNINGWWWWNPDCWNHQMFLSIDTSCAWSEGWADFYPLVINYEANNDDTCFDFDIGPCTGIPDERYYNLELHNLLDPWWLFAFGEGVEGRVAGSLFDLYDFNWPIENYDDAFFEFYPIANILIDNERQEQSFYNFWESWIGVEYNQHHAIRAFYQNTIDYNTYPYFNQPLPLLHVLENAPTYHHAIDLLPYSRDNESSPEELLYSISGYSGCNFSVTDGHWIDVTPWLDWTDNCWAQVELSDTIYSTNAYLDVMIHEVTDHAYLSIIRK